MQYAPRCGASAGGCVETAAKITAGRKYKIENVLYNLYSAMMFYLPRVVSTFYRLILG